MPNEVSARNPPWSRDELILALDLYVRFKGNPPGKGCLAPHLLGGALIWLFGCNIK